MTSLLDVDLIFYGNTHSRQTFKMALKISHSLGGRALHNPWDGEYDGFYTHSYAMLHGTTDLKIWSFIQWPDLITGAI